MTAVPARPSAVGAVARAGRAVVWCGAAVLVAVFVLGLALWSVRSQELLPLGLAPETWSPGELRAVLVGWGVPVNLYVAYFVLLELCVATVAGAAAFFVLRGAVTPFRLYLALVLVLYGTMSGTVPQIYGATVPGHGDVLQLLQGVAWVALFPLGYVFPNGRFVPSWTRWFAVGWALYLPYVLVLEMLGMPADAASATVPLLVLFGSAAAAAVYRHKRATPEERLQVRWVMIAIALRFVVSLVLLAPPLNDLQREVSSRGLATYVLGMSVSYAVAALLPAAVAVAIVRHRLFDVEVWLNRALIYAVLSAFVVGAYAAVVAGAGLAWRGEGGVVLPVVATALVAVLFHPVRERVQRAVSRLVYGQRGEPYALVARLGRRLESALPPDAVLQTIVDTVGPALKLRYARAALTGEAGVTYPPEAGSVPANAVTLPLRSHGEELGTLTVATRPGEILSAAERELLTEVTRRAGGAVQAANLTTALRRSRATLVTAREEERRRLHRDLHDGFGPTLASLYQRIDAARSLLDRDPDLAARLLEDAGELIRTTIGDIRRLVYQLRPPDLDRLGLVAAIEETGERLNAHPGRLTIEVAADHLPALPAVVEVAAYRIAMESLTNVVRHADADHVTVRLELAAGELSPALYLEIADDGCGITAAPSTGVGLTSMRERAEEIGGQLTVCSRKPRGTAVYARLPVPPAAGCAE